MYNWTLLLNKKYKSCTDSLTERKRFWKKESTGKFRRELGPRMKHLLDRYVTETALQLTVVVAKHQSLPYR
jgi:hypothetical protein